MTTLRMEPKRWTPRPLVTALVVGLLWVSLPGREARAETPKSDRTESLARIDATLHRAEVARGLARLGYSPSEIDARLSRLSDSDVAEVARHAQALRPAGDAADAFIGLLVVLVVLAFLVWLVIFMANHMDEGRGRRRHHTGRVALDHLM